MSRAVHSLRLVHPLKLLTGRCGAKEMLTLKVAFEPHCDSSYSP